MPGLYNWYEALSGCYKIGLAGKMGWHLPTIEQLASLVEMTSPSVYSYFIPIGHPFNNWLASSYWSSSTFAVNTTFAWSMNFAFKYGGAYEVDKSNALNVWCVRGGQSNDVY